ncbi:unnamed protein product [Diplocarpon coronariae]|nr:hypothetical protein JHW43_005528 [Diplocarpon mali]
MPESAFYFVPSVLEFREVFSSLGSLSALPKPQQWQVFYDLGKLISPPVSAFSAFCWGRNAWTAKGTKITRVYAAASGLTLGVVMWTVLAMMPTNNELMKMAKVAKEDAGS